MHTRDCKLEKKVQNLRTFKGTRPDNLNDPKFIGPKATT